MRRRTIGTSVRATPTMLLLHLAADACDRPDLAPAAYSWPCLVVLVLLVVVLLLLTLAASR